MNNIAIFLDLIAKFEAEEASVNLFTLSGGDHLESMNRKAIAAVFNAFEYFLNLNLRVLDMIDRSDYLQLDPQVGDNSCQIRALIVPLFCEFAKKSIDLESMKRNLENSRLELIELLNFYTSGGIDYRNMHSAFSDSLKSLSFKPVMSFLISCHLLSYSKTKIFRKISCKFHSTTISRDYKKIESLFFTETDSEIGLDSCKHEYRIIYDGYVHIDTIKEKLGTSKAKNVVLRCQQNVAAVSEYIMRKLHDSEEFRAIIGKKYSYDEQFVSALDSYNRVTVPCFLSFSIVFLAAHALHMPIALVVFVIDPKNGSKTGSFHAVYLPNEEADGLSYIFKEFTKVDCAYSHNAIQVEMIMYESGETEDVHLFLKKIDPIDWILGYAAVHPAFAKSVIQPDSMSPSSNAEKYRAKAYELGACIGHQDAKLVLYHVCPNSLQNVLVSIASLEKHMKDPFSSLDDAESIAERLAAIL